MSVETIDVRMINETVVGGLTSDDNGLRKEAQDNVSNYLRIKQREDGFARKHYNVVEVGAKDLDKQVDTPLPTIVKDIEPNSAGAVTVPFGTVPMDTNITAGRYRVMFDRIASKRYTADVNTLLTYDMDIRAILNEFILKDILAEEDRKWIVTVDSICGTVNVPDAIVGACHYITVGAMSRQSLTHAMKGLPSTNRRLSPASVLINNLTIWDVVGIMTRDVAGGDLSEELLISGWVTRKMLGVNWNITIKSDLVEDDVMYMFAEPKYLGDFMVLNNVTMSTKHEDYILQFFAYESVGCTVQNIAAVAKAEFSGTQKDWKTGS